MLPSPDAARRDAGDGPGGTARAGGGGAVSTARSGPNKSGNRRNGVHVIDAWRSEYCNRYSDANEAAGLVLTVCCLTVGAGSVVNSA